MRFRARSSCTIDAYDSSERFLQVPMVIWSAWIAKIQYSRIKGRDGRSANCRPLARCSGTCRAAWTCDLPRTLLLCNVSRIHYHPRLSHRDPRDRVSPVCNLSERRQQPQPSLHGPYHAAQQKRPPTSAQSSTHPNAQASAPLPPYTSPPSPSPSPATLPLESPYSAHSRGHPLATPWASSENTYHSPPRSSFPPFPPPSPASRFPSNTSRSPLFLAPLQSRATCASCNSCKT